MTERRSQPPRALTQAEFERLDQLHKQWREESRAERAKTQPGWMASVPGDEVNHPSHYTSGPIEVIEVIHGFRLGFNLGNVVKYVLRHGLKAGRVDLEKARWYLDDEIARQGGTSWNPTRTVVATPEQEES